MTVCWNYETCTGQNIPVAHHDGCHDLRQDPCIPGKWALRLEDRVCDESAERLRVRREWLHEQELGEHRPELAEVVALATMPPTLLPIVSARSTLLIFVIFVVWIL